VLKGGGKIVALYPSLGLLSRCSAKLNEYISREFVQTLPFDCLQTAFRIMNYQVARLKSPTDFFPLATESYRLGI
jgi:hypothetical protein